RRLRRPHLPAPVQGRLERRAGARGAAAPARPPVRPGRGRRVCQPSLMNDPYDLNRFVSAQERTYDAALAELRAGRKTSHWMWFVFPQIAGLGRSELSLRFAIGSLDEARAYLAHPVLGPRLRECATALLETEGRTAGEILGSIDALKLCSSMTLFR